MSSKGKRFLGWAALLAALGVIFFARPVWRSDSDDLRPGGGAAVAGDDRKDSSAVNDKAVTLPPLFKPTEPADGPLRYRTARETAKLRGRHRPHLDALGVPPGTAILPRKAPAKEGLEAPPGKLHAITVKFLDDYLARIDDEGHLTISAASDDALAEVVREHGLRFARGQTADADRVALLEARAMVRTGKMAADLEGIVSATPAARDAAAVRAAAEDLLALDAVEFVTLTSVDAPPPPPALVDIAPPSALLTSYQTYRGSGGIEMDWAWTNHQAKGAGVRVTDCEYAFNPDHEDLSTLVAPQPNVNSYYTGFGDDHGTAVLGVLAAGENGYGMTGMVPAASKHFYPEFSTVGGSFQGRSAAIVAAIADSDPGDVVLLEMQTGGAQGDYGPAEYDLAVWNAVKTGTDAGVIVVAAAGNGSENLDAVEYTAYRSRGDSGSIIVGAASSARAKLAFSTYGARVDVQGWGQGVATLGYGSLQTYGGDPNQMYTATFNGTSSASPVVTSAVVALQSYALDAMGRALAPEEMRDLLKTTGKPQTGSLSTPIGPLPDMQAAIEELILARENADLSGLTLFGATLSPAFDSGVTAYSAEVGSTVASVSLRPTSFLPDSSIEVRVNGGIYQPLASGATSGPLALDPGPNLIEIHVTSPMGRIEKAYSITVTRDTGNLSALALPGTTISPVFNPEVTSYSTWVAGAVSSITVRPTCSPAAATIKVRVNGGNYQAVASGSTSGPLALDYGPNVVDVLVTFPLHTGQKLYSVNVTRDTANLKVLSLFGVTLAPSFNPDVTSYSALVPGTLTSVSVRPTSYVPTAAIAVRINGGGYLPMSSGGASGPLALNYGSNLIEVLVTSPLSSAQRTYLVSLTRPGEPIVETPTSTAITPTEATLGGNVSHGGSSPVTQRGLVLVPASSPSAPVIGDVDAILIPVAGTTGVFSTRVTGLVPERTYRFRAFATNGSGTSYSPASTFRAKSIEARLQSLTFSHGPLSPAFSPELNHYDVIAGTDGTAFTLRADPQYSLATLRLKVNGGAFESFAAGAPGKVLALGIGANEVEVEVTAEDGVTVTNYHLGIVLPVPPEIRGPVVHGLSATGAVLGAEVVSDGGRPIIERGVVYAPASASPMPVIGGNSVSKASTSGTTGSFSLPVSNLIRGVRYSFRGFCRTETDTAYSEALGFVTSTVLEMEAGTEWILSGRNVPRGETVGFQIETAAMMQVLFAVSGASGVTVSLRNASGDLLSEWTGDGPALFDEILEAGVHSIEVFNRGTSGQTFTFSAESIPGRPDLSVGVTPAAVAGGTVDPPASVQLLPLVSRKLKPVRGYVGIRNASGTPSALKLRGSRGTADFGIQYADSRGNQTAAVTGGYYTTDVISRDEAGPVLTATCTPSKKRLSKKRGKKTVILKKRATFLINAASSPDGGLTDSVQIQVRTL